MGFIVGPTYLSPEGYDVNVAVETSVDGTLPREGEAYNVRVKFQTLRAVQATVSLLLPPYTNTYAPQPQGSVVQIYNGPLGNFFVDRSVVSEVAFGELVFTAIIDWNTPGGSRGSDRVSVNVPFAKSPAPLGRMVFRSEFPIGGNGPPIGQLWTMTADGQDRKRVFPDDEQTNYAAPDWAPDGSRIVFNAGLGYGSSDLYTVARDGSDLRLVSSANEVLNYPKWAPDGRRFLGMRYTPKPNFWELWAVDVDGANLTQATAPAQGEVVQVEWGVWTRDNRFAGLVGSEGNFGGLILLGPADFDRAVPGIEYNMDRGRDRMYLASNPAYDLLAYESRPGTTSSQTGSNISVFDLRSRVEWHIADGSNPAFSPDGRWLAFSRRSVDDGRISLRIFVMDVFGRDVRALSPLDAYDLGVAWSGHA